MLALFQTPNPAPITYLFVPVRQELGRFSLTPAQARIGMSLSSHFSDYVLAPVRWGWLQDIKCTYTVNLELQCIR